MKENRVGFYNSEVQRNLGQRLKKQRMPYARNPYIKAALKNGFLVEWIETQEKIRIEPQKYLSLIDVMEKLMAFPQMKKEKEVWQKIRKIKKNIMVLQL